MKKFLSLVFMVLFALAAYFFYQKYIKIPNTVIDSDQETLIGGDKDNGGCLIGAGYSWCENKQKCLRVWEEACEIIKNPTTPQDILKNIETPTDWKLEMESGKPEGCFAKYLTSPDYKMSEGYPVLEKGFQITIKLCETEETSIKEVFSSNPLKTSIARNINEINLGDIPVIQYDYSYEGTIATDTVFINNGYDYLVRLRYSIENDRFINWDIYQSMLNNIQQSLLDTPTTLE
jgi:hypothetical protein